MSHLTHTNLLLMAFCILTEAGRELCFKHGADGVNIRQALRSHYIWVGIVLWAVELVAWVRVLEQVPLTLAFPLMAMIYVITFFGGVMLLREPLSNRHALGAFLVTAGVALIGSSGI